MAQAKNTKKRTSSARSSSRSGSSRAASGSRRKVSRRAQRRAERSHLIASLVLCGVGLVMLALVLIKGPEESGWRLVRGWLFGVFGFASYLVWALLLYTGYLVGSGYSVGKFSVKVGLMLVLCSSVPVVFSNLTIRDESFAEIVKMLFTRGQTHFWSGGVLGGVIGGPLVAFCGHPAANIIVLLVFLIGLMIFFAVTPGDVVQYVLYQWQAWQERRAAALAEQNAYDTQLFEGGPEEEPLENLTEPLPPAPAPAAATMPRAARHRAFDANPYLDGAPQPAAQPAPRPAPAPAPRPAPAPAPRAGFDVDLGPDIETQALQNAIENDPLEPVVIGPGGTFGMDPLSQLGKHEPPPPAPVTTEFEQHIEEQPAPAEEAEPDALDDLIKKAMTAPAASVRVDLPPEVDEQSFDTALEPAPQTDGEPIQGILDFGGAAGIPTLGGSYDAARDAWNAGAPLAGALAAASAAPAADGAAHTPSHFRAKPAVPKEEPPVPDDITLMVSPAEIQAALAARNGAAAPADAPAEDDEDDLPWDTAPAPRPYAYPSLDLFNAARPEDEAGAEQEMRHNADILINTLDSFGVKTKILDICRGPSVTRYELQPQAGIKVSRITSLADDIALNLASAGVRIEAPIPGKPAVGIEVPNKIRSTVSIRNVFESPNYINMRSPLTMALGKDIAGTAQVADLCRMPHLLIAGSTGSGKSVCVNSIIISFLFRSSPDDVKLLLIDPKVVELAEYNGIPHLLMPVVTEPRKAAGALGASVAEMERRYQLFAEHNVREIKAYNKLAAADPSLEHLPYIAIVIDELADLMMVAGKEVEDYICRIAQKARAAGIHLIVATQRPSVDVITGLIKANIPSRIAFAVSSQVDSRTILDSAGAEKLLGNGDMLFLPVGAAKPLRVQGTFVTDEEIAAVLNFIKSTSDAQYDEEMIAEMERRAVAEKGSKKDADGDEAGAALDPMFDQAVECVIEAGQASTSLLQRRCKLGYARAARIMDQMEREKVIGPYEGAKPRSVLITLSQWQERKLSAHE